MNPGNLKHRITFQQFSEIENELGDVVKEWLDYKTVRAMIKTVQGREYFSASSTQNENTIRFIIRYTNGIHPDMRINFRGRYFEIESVINDDEMNKTLTIMGKEAV
jgi:SPP1 family predicted phage head-tail adaptor